MNSKSVDDQRIADLVNSVQHVVPEQLETELKNRLLTLKTLKTKKSPRSLFWIPIPVLTAVMILLFFFLPLVNQPEPKKEQEITEIKTEFFIKKKNIKIMWFSKKDFSLRREK